MSNIVKSEKFSEILSSAKEAGFACTASRGHRGGTGEYLTFTAKTAEGETVLAEEWQFSAKLKDIKSLKEIVEVCEIHTIHELDKHGNTIESRLVGLPGKDITVTETIEL